MQPEHHIPNALFGRPVHLTLIGCGGTGSLLAPRLVHLHRCMLALGHPGGLHVEIIDGGRVTPSSPYRQNFFDADVGLNKATVMVNRLNLAHGLKWVAWPLNLQAAGAKGPVLGDIVISCVDTRLARASIAAQLKSTRNVHRYWLDAGNNDHGGQVVVGELHAVGKRSKQPRLPLVNEFFPEIADPSLDDNRPSCSAMDAILSQGIATNGAVACVIYNWLATALRFGTIQWCGAFVNVPDGTTTPIPVCPETWERMLPARKKRGSGKRASSGNS